MTKPLQKVCSACGETKPIQCFNKGKKHDYQCRDCHNKRRQSLDNADRLAGRPTRGQQYAARQRLRIRQDSVYAAHHQLVQARKHFSIDLEKEDLLMMRARSGNRCYCCGKLEGKKRLAIDHCHETGKVRGLLCEGCNRGIGMLGDNETGVRLALIYLQNEFVPN